MQNPKLEKFLKYGLGAILIGIGGFASLFLIQSVFTLAIVAVVGLALYNGLPVLAQWAGHMKIAGLKWGASVNPIPELQLQYGKMEARIKEARKEVETFSVACKTYYQELVEYQKTDPVRAKEYEPLYNDMSKVLTHQLNSIQKSRDVLVDFGKMIQDEERSWKMSQAATKAGRAMRKVNQPDPIDEMRIRAARDATKESMNRAMAEMEMALVLDFHVANDVAKATQALPNGNVIDVKFNPAGETANVVQNYR